MNMKTKELIFRSCLLAIWIMLAYPVVTGVMVAAHLLSGPHWWDLIVSFGVWTIQLPDHSRVDLPWFLVVICVPVVVVYAMPAVWFLGGAGRGKGLPNQLLLATALPAPRQRSDVGFNGDEE